MNKLRLRLDDLVVDSFATAAGTGPRGTVQAHGTCWDTCVDLGCSGECTTSCGTSPGTNAGCVSGSGPVCGPTESDPNMSCGTGEAGCQTMYEWTGCDWSCEFACN